MNELRKSHAFQLKPILIGLLIASVLLGFSYDQVFGEPTLYSVRGSFDGDDLLRTLDPLDGSTIANVTITLQGELIQAGTGLATHSINGKLYAILKISGQVGRELVTINPNTGVAISIGDTGRFFAAIAFDETGKLYGMTGNKDVIDGRTETLFEISLSDASTSYICVLASEGDDGEVIAFNPNDSLLYHFAGDLDQEMEKFDPDLFSCDTTTIDRTLPDDYGINSGLAYWPSQDAFLRTGFTLANDFSDQIGSAFLWKVPSNGSTPTKIGPTEAPNFFNFTVPSIFSNLALVTNSPETLYSLDQNHNDRDASDLLVLNITDASIISSTPVLLNNVDNVTAIALASDSLGTLWAIVDEESSFEELVTLDITLSPVVATSIGNNAGRGLVDIAFDDSDNLFALDEDRKLYSVDKIFGTRSFVCNLGGFDGTGGDFVGANIRFNTIDNLMYHESQDSPNFPTITSNFEKFDIDLFNCDIATPIPINFPFDEPLALTFWEEGNVLLLAHFDAPTLANVTEAGQFLNVGLPDHTPKGLAFADPSQQGGDSDGDGVLDGVDNCPNDPNPLQENLDLDNLGDACDALNVIIVDTIVSSDFTSLGNLIVQGNSLLTINPGVTVTIQSGSNITIDSGSGVLIKSGGTLQVNS